MKTAATLILVLACPLAGNLFRELGFPHDTGAIVLLREILRTSANAAHSFREE
jgi:hypothetical protein